MRTEARLGGHRSAYGAKRTGRRSLVPNIGTRMPLGGLLLPTRTQIANRSASIEYVGSRGREHAYGGRRG